MGEWCWRPSNRRTCENSDPLLAARRWFQASTRSLAVTGFFPGAGTRLSKRAFGTSSIGGRNRAAWWEGDSYHRFERAVPMKAEIGQGPRAGVNFLALRDRRPTSSDTSSKSCSAPTAKTGNGEKLYYLHSPRKHASTTAGLAPAWIPVHFTALEPISPDTDVLF